MTKLEHLEREVRELSTEELTTFREWFGTFDAMEWDKQIERDAFTGQLSRLADAALTEHKAGRSRLL